MTPATLLLAVGSVLVAAAGQVLMRISQTSSAVFTLAGVRLSAALLFALACHGTAAILWLLVLARVPLSRAYPITALTQVIVPLAAWGLLREPLSWRTVAAVVLATGAVLVVR